MCLRSILVAFLYTRPFIKCTALAVIRKPLRMVEIIFIRNAWVIATIHLKRHVTGDFFIRLVLKHQQSARPNNNCWYISIVSRSSAMFDCVDTFTIKYFTMESFKKAMKTLQKSGYLHLRPQPQISCATLLDKLLLQTRSEGRE